MRGDAPKIFFFNENALSGSIHSTYQLASLQTDQIPTLGQSRTRTLHTSHLQYLPQYPVVGGVLLATLEEVLGKETFNEAVKGAVAEAYFFLADIFIRWPDIYNIYKYLPISIP